MMKTKKCWGIIAAIFVVLFAGCSNFPALQATEVTTAPATATPTQQPVPTPATDEPATATNLVVWLPPQFSPNEDTPSGELLLERLAEFNNQYPNLSVNFRIKAETGAASLLESMKTASKAAPLALPDLVLLSTKDMVHAADQELIFPYPNNFFPEDDEDWYSVAFSLGNYQLQTYGIPLAADALVAAYNPLVVESFPTNWNDLLLEEHSIAFPPADPDAIYTLALYLSYQGRLLDDDNEIIMEAQPLEDIFSLYFQALSSNLLPSNPSQLDTDGSAYNQLEAGRSSIAITWASRYLSLSNSPFIATTPPTPEGNPYTLATGWVWAVASHDPNKRAAAMELARFMSEAEFTGPWTESANLLPLRPSAIDLWKDEQERGLAGLLLSAADPVPPPRVLGAVSSPIRDAVLDVLTGVLTPVEASQSVVDSLGN